MKKVCIIGIGLIGGSIGMDIKRLGLAREVVGVVRRPEAVAESVQAGAVDQATLDLQAAVTGSDLIIIATPVATTIPKVREIKNALKSGAIVIDVASVKGKLVRELDQVIGQSVCYVGTHPMAGSEIKGVSGAKSGLFNGATCIITATERTDQQALKVVREFWQKLGAKIVDLSPEEHDRLVAYTSHLPHLVAASLVNTLAELPQAEQGVGSGFKDTTRIAGSNPALWQEICEWNRDQILTGIQSFKKEVAEIENSLAASDWQKLLAILTKAKTLRDQL